MKSQVFSEKQIKDLAEGKEVVVVEPVKKGEYLDVHPTKGTPCIMIKYLKETMMSILSFVGEVVQASNEKGEKQWFCPKCNNIVKQKKELNYYECECNGGWTDFKPPLQKDFPWKPLLVRLEKIEEQKTMYINNWLETFKRVEE